MIKPKGKQMFNKLTILASIMCASMSYAETVPISGTVQSQCSIVTDRAGTYGNRADPEILSTASQSGGNPASIRIDVVSGDVYTALISLPQDFSSSPVLKDTVSWDGTILTSQVSDPAMADYNSTAIDYGMAKEYNLHTAGSVWIEVNSTAVYGGSKPFPGGNYTALINVQCIPK